MTNCPRCLSPLELDGNCPNECRPFQSKIEEEEYFDDLEDISVNVYEDESITN